MKKNIIILIIVLLIIFCVIIAALIGLSTAGISTVQQAQRDNERMNALNSINIELAGFYADNSTYPSSITINGSSRDTVNISTDRIVKLKGAAVALPSTATKSTSQGTKYCYYVSGNDYVVGAYLEEKDNYNTLGNLPAATCAAYPL